MTGTRVTGPRIANLVRRGEKLPRPGSDLEGTLALVLRASVDRLPELANYAREHRPFTHRGWLIDFAWPPLRIAVEVDGLVGDNWGGHQTIDGILADAEKTEALLLDGWIVYRVPGPWINTRLRDVVETIARLLEGQMLPPPDDRTIGDWAE